MLTFDQIKAYFSPELSRLNPKGIAVEYLQYEFLDSLFKHSGSEKLSFIGGTAIHLIHNSQRFSEDLDFDNFGLNYSNFKELILKACGEMGKKGLALESRFLEKGDTYHCYIKFPDILKKFGIPAHHQEKVFISIDAEKKKKIFTPEIKALNKFGVFRNIAVNPAPILLSQKLIAILQRKREKGRDFYDVSFLAGLAKPDYSYIEKTLGLKTAEFKDKLIHRCENFNYKELAKDVSPFLFTPKHEERILTFKNTISDLLEISPKI